MNTGLRHVHPLVAFIYYGGAISLLFIYPHPWFILTSLGVAVCLNLVQGSFSKKGSWLYFYIGMSLVWFLVNPLISHQGEHLLFYLGKLPITLEAVMYGFFAAIQLFTLFMWILSAQQVLASSQILFLFSNISPKGAMLVSMALRSFTLLTIRFQQLMRIHRSYDEHLNMSARKKQLVLGMSMVQMMLTWTLEEGLHTADSMKARGYHSGQRSQFTLYHWSKRDKVLLMIWIVLASGSLTSVFLRLVTFEYYPQRSPLTLTLDQWMVYGCVTIYLIIPVLIEGRDWLKWRSLNSMM